MIPTGLRDSPLELSPNHDGVNELPWSMLGNGAECDQEPVKLLVGSLLERGFQGDFLALHMYVYYFPGGLGNLHTTPHHTISHPM